MTQKRLPFVQRLYRLFVMFNVFLTPIAPARRSDAGSLNYQIIRSNVGNKLQLSLGLRIATMDSPCKEKAFNEALAFEKPEFHAEKADRLLCSMEAAFAGAIRDEEEAIDRQETLLRQLQAMPALSRGTDFWIQLQAAEVNASRDVENAAELRALFHRRIEAMQSQGVPRRVERAALREKEFLMNALEDLEFKYADEKAALQERYVEEKATLERQLRDVVALQARRSA